MGLSFTYPIAVNLGNVTTGGRRNTFIRYGCYYFGVSGGKQYPKPTVVTFSGSDVCDFSAYHAVMFVMAFGIGAIPGFLALALHTIGSLTKLFYESLETVSDKPVRGLAACGASQLQRMRFALWPQVKPIFLSYSFMRLEINFRQSTILGLVGAGGIGQELMTSIKLDRYDQVSITLLLIIIVVSLLDYTSGKLRKRVVEGA